MKNRIINDVIYGMTSSLNSEQLSQLKAVMSVVLKDYEVLKAETAVSVNSDNYMYYIERFAAAEILKGHSDGTVKAYIYTLKTFFETTGISVAHADINTVIAYFAQLTLKGYSVSYFNNIHATISSFYKWAFKNKFAVVNPMAYVDRLSPEKIITVPFSQVELEKLRRACEQKRDRALVELLYASGARVSEVAAMNISDVDFEKKEVVILRGKGNKQRVVYISSVCCMLLKEYLESRVDDNSALFVSLKSPYERMGKGGLEDIVKRIGKVAGVENVHPHRFRRTNATDLLDSGMNIDEVKEILGHENIQTTLIYSKVKQENVKHSYRKIMK